MLLIIIWYSYLPVIGVHEMHDVIVAVDSLVPIILIRRRGWTLCHTYTWYARCLIVDGARESLEVSDVLVHFAPVLQQRSAILPARVL